MGNTSFSECAYGGSADSTLWLQERILESQNVCEERKPER